MRDLPPINLIDSLFTPQRYGIITTWLSYPNLYDRVVDWGCLLLRLPNVLLIWIVVLSQHNSLEGLALT